MDKQKIAGWCLKFAWLLVLCLAILTASQYTISKINSCTSNPLVFAVSEIKNSYEDNISVSGTLTIFEKMPIIFYFGDGADYMNKPNTAIPKDYFKLPANFYEINITNST